MTKTTGSPNTSDDVAPVSFDDEYAVVPLPARDVDSAGNRTNADVRRCCRVSPR